MRYVANDIANKVHAALEKVEWKSNIILDTRFRELELRWREIDDELKAWIQKTEANEGGLLKATDSPYAVCGKVKTAGSSHLASHRSRPSLTHR